MLRFLHELLASQAAARPEQLAICWKEERIPYGEVDRLTNQLAQTLRAHGCHPGDQVAVLIPNSPNALFAVLGILKAGCVAVPLDLATPAPQLAKLLDDSRPSAILAARAARPVLDELFANHSLGQPASAVVSIGTLEALPIVGDRFATTFSGLEALQQSVEPLVSHTTINSPALLFARSIEFASDVSDASRSPIFEATMIAPVTSPPTIVTHAEVLAFLKNFHEKMPLNEFDRVASLPLQSPLAVAMTFAALAAGAELHLIPPELLARPKPLAAFVRSQELTDWLTNHGLLSELAGSGTICDGDFPSLKRLLWTGEPLPAATLQDLMQRLPLTHFLRATQPANSKLSGQSLIAEQLCEPETIPAWPPVLEPLSVGYTVSVGS